MSNPTPWTPWGICRLRKVETCHAMQTEQLNGIRAVPDPGREQHQAQESEILLNIKVQLEAEIATTACWKNRVTAILGNLSKRPTSPRLWMAKWCLRSMTPKFWDIKAAEVGQPLEGRGPIKTSEIFFLSMPFLYLLVMLSYYPVYFLHSTNHTMKLFCLLVSLSNRYLVCLSHC